MAHEAEKKEVVDNDKAYANNAEDYNNRDKKGDEKIQVVDMHYDQPDKSWNQMTSSTLPMKMGRWLMICIRMNVTRRDTLYLRKTVPASPLGSNEEAGVLRRPSKSVESS